MSEELTRALRSWLRTPNGNQRFGYLTVNSLGAALGEPRVLDALVEEAGLADVKRAVLKTLPPMKKFQAICERIQEEIGRDISIWHKAQRGDVLAAFLWEADLPLKLGRRLFGPVNREEDLAPPVARWMQSAGMQVYEEIPMGRNRCDVVGYRQAAWGGLQGERIVAVELKNDVKELKRAMDQLTSYRDYSHQVYIACPPALAMQYTIETGRSRGAPGWDSGVLDRKIRACGAGLLLVEGDAVSITIEAKENDVQSRAADAVRRQLSDGTRLDLDRLPEAKVRR